MNHERTTKKGKALCGSSSNYFKMPTLVDCPECKKIVADNKQQDMCAYYFGYYLVGIDSNNQFKTLDGSHSSPKDVQKALELYKRLHLSKENLSYKLVYLKETYWFKRNWEIGRHEGQGLQDAYEKGLFTLKEVPQSYKVKLNEEAISIMAPIIKAHTVSK